MSAKVYDLDSRTFTFAREVRCFLREIYMDVINFEDIKQLTRSSGSVGANYIEANEGFSKKDFRFRIMTCKKEAKESIYWLRLLFIKDEQMEFERYRLISEARELVKIFSSILKE